VIGGGRKVAIHILEFFDRIGYTRRVRDTHVLRGRAGAIRIMNNGRNRSPVGRPVFKTGRACQTGLGRFDSCFLPPDSASARPYLCHLRLAVQKHCLRLGFVFAAQGAFSLNSHARYQKL
jgi:hypothetical protein